MEVTLEQKKCPNCIVKDGIPRCKKLGYKICNAMNCPHDHISQDEYDYDD